MASKFLRHQKWWIKFWHPLSGALIRENLETTDEARAELLRTRVALEVSLLEPRLQSLPLPQPIREKLFLHDIPLPPIDASLPLPPPPPFNPEVTPAIQPANRTRVRQCRQRRERIMAQLVDPLSAVLYQRAFPGSSSSPDDVPLALVPTRKLRARVAELNLQVARLLDGASEEPSPPSSSQPVPADLDREVGNAVHTPRRRGRRPESQRPFPLLPFMAHQRFVLDHLINFSGFFVPDPGLGRRRRCPSCASGAEPGPGGDVLSVTIYPTAAGDLVFRCHRCGYCLDSTEFLARDHCVKTLPQAADTLCRLGYLTQALPAAQLKGYQRLARVRDLIALGQPRYRRSLDRNCHAALVLGWALLYTRTLRELFADRQLPADLADECLGRLSYDIYGRPSALILHTVRGRTPLFRLELRDWEPPAPLTLFLPSWAEHTEFNGLLLCPNYALFLPIANAVQAWPAHERIAVAQVERCLDCWHEPIHPFQVIWVLQRGPRSGSFALPLCAPGTQAGEEAPRVIVHRFPEAVAYAPDSIDPVHHIIPATFQAPDRAPELLADTARLIAAEQDHQALPGVLAELFSAPGIHRSTRARLLQDLSGRTGKEPDALVGQDVQLWTGGPYALNATGGVMYVAREGQYWRRGRRAQDFSAVTNFVVRLAGCDTGANGKMTHRLGLEVSGQNAALSVTSATLNNSKRLFCALTDAAGAAGLDYPVVSDPKAKRLLSELIKATQPNGPASNSSY